jgi:hypothetical protein
MSTRLHEALAELAEEMPAARIDDDLWTRAARGKRRRRVASIGAAFAAVLIVVAGVAWLPRQFDGAHSLQPAAPTPDGRGIPDRIHDPWPWTPTIDQYPAGAASVALQGPLVRDSLGGALDEGRLVVIGDGEDTYRNLAPFPQIPPGILSMLSPDGTRLAYPSPELRNTLMIRDLRTGKARAYRGGHQPLAWSPDGRSLAVWVYTGLIGDDLGVEVFRLDVATGQATKLLDRASAPTFVPGLVAAWSPDGARLAVALGRRLHVIGAGATASFDLPERTLLAGPGAWSADGTSVLVQQLGSCDGPCRGAEQSAWLLRSVDVATGKIGESGFAAQESYAVVRVIAWRSAQSVIAVRYQPDAPPDQIFSPDVGYMDHVWPRSVEVAELSREGRDRTVVAYDGVDHLDIAADLAATGAVREAGWLAPWPVHDYWVPVFVVPTLLVVALIALVIWVRPRRRRA